MGLQTHGVSDSFRPISARDCDIACARTHERHAKVPKFVPQVLDRVQADQRSDEHADPFDAARRCRSTSGESRRRPSTVSLAAADPCARRKRARAREPSRGLTSRRNRSRYRSMSTRSTNPRRTVCESQLKGLLVSAELWGIDISSSPKPAGLSGRGFQRSQMQ